MSSNHLNCDKQLSSNVVSRTASRIAFVTIQSDPTETGYVERHYRPHRSAGRVWT